MRSTARAATSTIAGERRRECVDGTIRVLSHRRKGPGLDAHISRLREGVILANDRAESQPMMGGDFDLERFVTAQAPVFDTVLAELMEGRKRTHWMWFIFPQLRGLGHSPTAQFYGIGSIAEARAYHAHPVLGARLDLCASTVLESRARALREIFGSPDDLKFASCMTLFEVAVPEVQLFGQALDRWCAGKRDGRTLELLRMHRSAGT